MDATKGMTFDIFRGTTHDGPGMRTTVFFKGCPLECAWCHNPEGIKFEQEIWWEARKCIGCLICRETCRNAAIATDGNAIRLNRSKCKRCGACVDACPAQALAFTGRECTVEGLAREVLKDKDYFEAFSGGVTASGGEPLGQYEFVAEFFRCLKEKETHTALDTCGLTPVRAFETVLPFTDCVLYDVKTIDPVLHKKFTGQSNELILKNVIYLADYIRKIKNNLTLWIRTPLIPGATVDEENISAIGRFIRAKLADVLERWELCAFNNVCKSKYSKIGKPWIYENTRLMDQGVVDKIKLAALSAGIPPNQLVVSGLIAKAG